MQATTGNWLLDEIRAAQRRTGIQLDQMMGKGCARIYDELTPEALHAWKALNIPDQLLTSSHLNTIRTYVEACGLQLPETPKKTRRSRRPKAQHYLSNLDSQ